MGDRANVMVTSEHYGETYLYTHWGAHSLCEDVQRALAKKWRWNDPSYLTRIIFEEMVGERDRFTETGYGISARIGDPGQFIIEIDVDRQTVTKDGCTWSFEDFLTQAFV